MSSRRRSGHNLTSSANKLKLDSISKILKIDSAKSKKQRKDAITKQVSRVALTELIKNSPTTVRVEAPDFRTFLSREENIKVFKEFLQSQYSQENLNFYLACEKYRKLDPDLVGREMVKFMAAQIFNDYLSENARQPINVNNSFSETIRANMKNPQPDLFLEVQAEIYDLMRTDCYPRFCKTYQLDKNLAKDILLRSEQQRAQQALLSQTASSISDRSASGRHLNESHFSSSTSFRSSRVDRLIDNSMTNQCPPECPYFSIGRLPCQRHGCSTSSPSVGSLKRKLDSKSMHQVIDLKTIHRVPSVCKRRNCPSPPPPLPPKPDNLDYITNMRQRPYAARACRVNSELLKGYTRKTIERLLDIEQFESIYWHDEPISASSLSKAIGFNITFAETHFHIDGLHKKSESVETSANKSTTNEVDSDETSPAVSLIQDIFVTCSVNRDRSYGLSINLEIDNPFKVIDIYYEIPRAVQEQQQRQQQDENSIRTIKRRGKFRMRLPQSTLLVQLNQRIRYDECLAINYVQLAPAVNYEIECTGCNESEQAYLDKIFSKRLSQFDAEFDAVLSEKILFGLQLLLNQQRIDLDLYMG